jgi:hypothetical protein
VLHRSAGALTRSNAVGLEIALRAVRNYNIFRGLAVLTRLFRFPFPAAA